MGNFINRFCPYCGGNCVEEITREDFTKNKNITTYICYDCCDEIKFEDLYNTMTDKYCDNCNTKMTHNNNWWECPNCHYGFMDLSVDIPKLSDEEAEMTKHIFESKLYIPCNNVQSVGKAVGSLEPQTLTITNCEKIKIHHKEMDIDFEFDTSKLENIDKIIINGYKFVREG